MNVNEARAAIQHFIGSHIRIDAWGLNYPDQVKDVGQPPSIARENPTRDITATGFFPGEGSPNPMVAEMKLGYTIMFRFDAAYTYHQIPKSQAETVILRMVHKLSVYPDCLDEEFRSIELSGNVVIAELENKDWILAYELSFKALFELEPDDLVAISPLMQPQDLLAPVMPPEEVQGEWSDPIVAAANLDGLRVVAIANGQLVYADHRNLSHAHSVVGILRAATIAGATTQVMTEGLVFNAAWAWEANRPIFLGQNGQLTQTAPLEGFVLQVATVLSPTQIQFELEAPFIYG